MVTEHNDISAAVVDLFRGFFKDLGTSRIADQLQVIKLFPRLFSSEDSLSIGRPVTMAEIERVLKMCAKEKSLGPDGWTVEFYLGFWDILGADLCQLVEETRSKGFISGAMNSTFIALILKVSKLTSFDVFRPISLCNFIYKLISKSIAERLKPFLAKVITPEQFGFLHHHQILDVVGVTQEGIHSIKTKKLPAILLKLDLIKAYDKIDWNFLRLLLLQIGLDQELVCWIMACVTNVQFSVLVNGAPSSFFHSSRGLRQGCPLSPLLFILVMDSLSRLIASYKNQNLISGIKVSPHQIISHVLFVDDVLLFGGNSMEEWQRFHEILTLFCYVSGMNISCTKSSLIAPGGIIDDRIRGILPFPVITMEEGFKYLGFTLKLDSYRKKV